MAGKTEKLFLSIIPKTARAKARGQKKHVVTRSNKGSYKSSLIRSFSFYIIKIVWQVLLLNLTRLLKTGKTLFCEDRP